MSKSQSTSSTKRKCSMRVSSLTKLDENVDLIDGPIEGALLANRFKIRTFIDKGTYGMVYKVKDTLNEA